MKIFVLLVYGIALLFVFIYSLIQLQLMFKYKRYKKDQLVRLKKGVKLQDFPTVTIQLPLFNEPYVAERLVDAVAQMDYPIDKMEIQVLDDSTDETIELLNKKVAPYKNSGLNIELIRRKDRKGFKAGALEAGLNQCSGEFIAIFDADFVPQKDFLKKVIPHFIEKEIGMIQCCWKHLNQHYSTLTAMQAFGLDAHFSIEQGGRNAGHHFINFNGTAGVWRKKAIIDAGGWQADTLTEDLDLSYRAQMKGWEFLYLEEVGAPAELPATMNALKTQQFRWNKGAAECVRKNLWKVLSNKDISFGTKINASFHLMNSTVFVAVILLAVLSLPLLFIKNEMVEYRWLFNLAGVFLISIPILAAFYWKSMSQNYANKWKAFLHFLWLFPMFLSVSMGMSLHNSKAVLEGYLGKKTPFIRTPKFNLGNQKSRQQTNNQKIIMKPIAFIEFLLALYFLFGIFLAFRLHDYGLLPFHLMLFLGFTYVSFHSIFEGLKGSK